MLIQTVLERDRERVTEIYSKNNNNNKNTTAYFMKMHEFGNQISL